MSEHPFAARDADLASPGIQGFDNAGLEMLDLLEQGVLLLGRGATVLFVNCAAEEALRGRSGLHVQAGRLFGGTCADTTALHRLIAGCTSGAADAGGSIALSRTAGSAPLFLVVAPVRAAGNGVSSRQPVALVFVTDPERAVPVSARQLRDGFGLTPAEAAVALELIAGDGLRAVANRLGISLGTVRTHLSQVFAKTGTRRQAELVRLIFTSRPNVRSDGGQQRPKPTASFSLSRSELRPMGNTSLQKPSPSTPAGPLQSRV